MEQNKIEEQEPVEKVEDDDLPWYGIVICIAGIVFALIGLANSLNWFFWGASSSDEIGSYEVETESGKRFDLYDMERDIEYLQKQYRVDRATLEARSSVAERYHSFTQEVSV